MPFVIVLVLLLALPSAALVAYSERKRRAFERACRVQMQGQR